MHSGEQGMLRGAATHVGVLLAFLLLPVTFAFAGVQGAAGPDFPDTVNVGDTFQGRWTVINLSDGTNATNPLRRLVIFLTPSCGGSGAVCSACGRGSRGFRYREPDRGSAHLLWWFWRCGRSHLHARRAGRHDR